MNGHYDGQFGGPRDLHLGTGPDRKSFGQSDEEVIKWALETFRPEDEILAATREEAETRGLPALHVGAFDARHLEILVRLLNAKKVVEIGTLSGYSGIALARGMGAGGRLHTFELDPHHALVAKQSMERARLMSEVVVHAGPALENLPRIQNEAPFDLVFIDADKPNYPAYLAWATNHLRVGGAVIADNTFAWNKIHMKYDVPAELQKSVAALREFNQIIANSSRFRATILPTAEGLTVAVKIA